MTSKAINPPALDPKVVVKLESDMCKVKYPMIITDHSVYSTQTVCMCYTYRQLKHYIL